MTGQGVPGDDSTVATVLRLADLAGRIEQVEGAATRRIDQLARELATAQDQLGALSDRAGEIEHRLTEVGALLSRLSRQIGEVVSRSDEDEEGKPGYQVNQPPPWWRPDDQRCEDAADRLTAWVEDVYRPVYGYLADLLAPCWRRHPLCLAYLDPLHEAWCLLYLPHRDPKVVFAQLDWLNRSLMQSAEVMANETRRCRDMNRHCDAGQDAAPFLSSLRGNTRR